MKKKKVDNSEAKSNKKEELLSRRAAIKRIATAVAGATAVGMGLINPPEVKAETRLAR